MLWKIQIFILLKYFNEHILTLQWNGKYEVNVKSIQLYYSLNFLFTFKGKPLFYIIIIKKLL